MTTTPTVHAKVRRWALDGQPDAWLAMAWVLDTDQATSLPIARLHRHASAYTWPEAMQEAQVLRAELKRELMDEVHASRSNRRTERAAQLAAEQPPVPTAVCIWCRQLGHPIHECPSWHAIAEANR